MKKFLVMLFMFFLSLQSQAQTVTSTIIDISNDEDITRVYLKNGTILKINHSTNMLEVGKNYRFEFSPESRMITLVSEIRHPTRFGDSTMETFNYHGLFETYFPTILTDEAQANTLFSTLQYKHKTSECFNRAHTWSYSLRKDHNVYTSKVWIFFTRKYIRKFDFPWWFHVAPIMHISDNGKVTERIADKKYATKVLPMKKWTDIFMRNSMECPLIETYSDYADYPETGWCYIMKTNMYYYQPIDLENLERDGTEKTAWNFFELQQAFKDALDVEI